MTAATLTDPVKQQLQQQFDSPKDYLVAAQKLVADARLVEADSLLAEAQARFPDDRDLAVRRARLAHVKQDWSEAAERWCAVRTRHPEMLEPYLMEVRMLTRLKRLREAEALAIAGATRFPHCAELGCELGWVAFREHRWEEAAARFLDVRTRFPTARDGYRGGAQILRLQGKPGDAERLLEDGMRRLPDDVQIRVEHARIPLARASAHRLDIRDIEKGVRRFNRLLELFPQSEHGYLAGITALTSAGRVQEADALAAEAMRRFPSRADFAGHYAKIAERQGNSAAAADRFALMMERFPENPTGHIGTATALAKLGRFDEAEGILQTAVRRFSWHFAAHAAYAELPVGYHDWAEVLRRWEAIRRCFPQDGRVGRRIFEVRLRITETDPDALATGSPAIGAESSAEPSGRQELYDLVMQFESLGGFALGCEFGLFQREFDAEPLGLLRWAEVTPAQLVAALEARFAGVGQLENTRLLIPQLGQEQEYGTIDTRFGMRMHTFASVRDVPADRMLNQACRRLAYLGGKLISDLELGQKIFVYRTTDHSLTDDEIGGLHRAMRAYGDNLLLSVRYADTEHPNGTVEPVRPGLLIGYIDRFRMSLDGADGAPNTRSWIGICRAALALRERAAL